MTVTIVSIWLLAASGVQLGTLWIMKTSILPLLDSLPYDRYVSTCQRIDMHVFHPIALWNGVISMGLGVAAAFAAPTAVSAALFVAGAVAMGGVGLTSEGVNRPIWRQIEMWSSRRPASRWAEKRRTWSVAHEVRTFSALAAALCFGAAALLVATA